MTKKKKWLAFGGVVMAALLIVGIFAAAFPKKKACKHVFDEGTVAIAATCTTDGKMVYTCTECGEVKVKRVKGGHNYCDPYESLKYCSTDEIDYESECLRCGDIVTTTEEVFDVPHFDADEDGNCDYCNNDLLKIIEGSETVRTEYGMPVEGWYQLYDGVEYVFSIESIDYTSLELGDYDFNPRIDTTDSSAIICLYNESGDCWNYELLGEFALQDENLGFWIIPKFKVFVHLDGYVYVPKVLNFDICIGYTPDVYMDDIGATGTVQVTLGGLVGPVDRYYRID